MVEILDENIVSCKGDLSSELKDMLKNRHIFQDLTKLPIAITCKIR